MTECQADFAADVDELLVLVLVLAAFAGAALSFAGAADFSLEAPEPASPEFVPVFVSEVFDERSRERFASDRASLL